MSTAGDRTANLRYRCLAADKWSRYPALQDVDMDCNSITNLESATFCDGTYMGPGDSFDITTSHELDIKSSTKIDIMTATNDITMNDADRTIRMMTSTDTLNPNIITFGAGLSAIVSENITVQNSADISIVTDNSNGLIVLSTSAGQQTFTMDPGYTGITSDPTTTLSVTDYNSNTTSVVLRPAQATLALSVTKNGGNASNITLDASDGVAAISAGVRYKKSQALLGGGSYTPIPSDYALSFSTSTTIVMPLITGSTVGQQYIITNTGTGQAALTVQPAAASSQDFYTKTGKFASITLPAGYSYIFTAIKTTANTVYGWSAL